MSQGTSKSRPDVQEFLTILQLSVRWQLSQRQIKREIERGTLIAHRFGRSVRIAKEDILLYEATRRRKMS
jgi:excisionase family DNA binding protein